jgi:DNA-damage-inducible protein D
VEWRNVETVALKKAKIACEQASLAASNHFVDATKGITGGKGSVQQVKDYHLSRFACYLIAMNGDSRKEEIAAA